MEYWEKEIAELRAEVVRQWLYVHKQECGTDLPWEHEACQWPLPVTIRRIGKEKVRGLLALVAGAEVARMDGEHIEMWRLREEIVRQGVPDGGDGWVGYGCSS